MLGRLRPVNKAILLVAQLRALSCGVGFETLVVRRKQVWQWEPELLNEDTVTYAFTILVADSTCFETGVVGAAVLKRCFSAWSLCHSR